MDLNVKSVFNTIRLYVLQSRVVLDTIAEYYRSPFPNWDAEISSRFAPLLQKNATLEDPSRVIVTASVAGLGVGSLGENATFGYSASKGTYATASPLPN